MTDPPAEQSAEQSAEQVPPAVYRLSCEMVRMASLHLFSNADPRYYKNTTQTVPNSQIPDEHWQPINRETSDPWSQYNTLKKWADEDREFVRNVRLERQVSRPVWEPFETDSDHLFRPA